MLFGRSRRPAAPAGHLLFADSAKDTIDLARVESTRLLHEYIGTEHLLLALLTPGSRSESFLRSLSVDTEVIRHVIEAQCPTGRSNDANPPFTSRAKKVLDLALQEAMDSGVTGVESEFLVTGLLLEQKGIGAQVLMRDAGLSLEIVRDAIRKASNAAFRVTVSDTSDMPIAEQIVLQIEHAVASGRLNVGDKLPTVRALAESVNVAPGTVARAYAELEKRGVVKTDGARGTTVAEGRPSGARTQERVMALSLLMKPVAVEGFHIGATADDLREALERAIAELRLSRD